MSNRIVRCLLLFLSLVWSHTLLAATSKSLVNGDYCSPYQLSCTAYSSAQPSTTAYSGIRCTLGNACDYGSPDGQVSTPFSCTGFMCVPPAVSSLAFTTTSWDSNNKICGMVSGNKHCWNATSGTAGTSLLVTYLGQCDASGNFCGDKDKDGVKDAPDKFPTNAAAAYDTDNDGLPDSWLPGNPYGCAAAASTCNGLVLDTDDDADGVTDVADNCPTAANVNQLDTDTDGMGDACDSDDDNDGVADGSDACPLDGTASSGNNDGDALCNLSDPDDDNDGIADVADNCPLLSNANQLDTDGDLQGNVCDADDDNDGVADAADKFPLDASESADNDNDGTGNNADPDDDNDTVADAADNCPWQANASQQNEDGDGNGDVCDTDSAGRLDVSFVPGYVAGTPFEYGLVASVRLQQDGKILLATNNSSTQPIARVYANGTVDEGFDRSGFSSSLYSISVMPDQRILAAGGDSNTPGRIAMLNPDGSRDTSFATGTGASSSIRRLLRQPDGKILIAGSFSSFNGTAINRLARLNADGSLDASFNPGSGANNFVYALALQADGKILIGGVFTTFNGVAIRRLARLNEDGSLDTSFVTGTGPADEVNDIVLDRAGRILIVGSFTSYNGVTAKRVARLNADGSLDTGFNTGAGADNSVLALLVQADNKVILGGQFSQFNGQSLKRIARLNPDGSVDAGFYPGTGADSTVASLAMQADGKVLLGGSFLNYDGIPITRIARIHTGDQDQDGTEDAVDFFPLDATETADYDGDGIGNNADPDDDNDGVPDAVDPEPLNAANADLWPLNGGYTGSVVRENVSR